ncbi:MAG: hypothetical protein ACFFG0_34820 [Candidatus Thorarchaeota archaeon]
MDNSKFLEYIREDIKSMENRLTDEIKSLRTDISQIFQDIYNIQKEVSDIKEKVKDNDLSKEELKNLKVKVDGMLETINELKDKCNKDDISVKKITTICTTISTSLSVIASIIANKI